MDYEVEKAENKYILSLIITCYNEEKYIERCIDSILKQFRKGVEIIVINDCSTDSSSTIINRYNAQIKSFSLSQNHGLSYARNYGIQHSQGQYLMFVDGDDYIADGILFELTKRLIEENPDILFGLIETFKESPSVIDRWNEPDITNSRIFDNKSTGEILLKILDLKFKMPPAQRYIVRKEFIMENGLLFESIFHEDELWTPQILCLAKTITFIHKTVFYHMISEHGLGGRLDEPDILSYLYICQKLIDFSNQLQDEKKRLFIKKRCQYTITKIHKRLNEWNEKRKETFLNQNGKTMFKITKQLT